MPFNLHYEKETKNYHFPLFPNFDHFFNVVSVSFKIMWDSHTVLVQKSKDRRTYIFTIYVKKNHNLWLDILIMSKKPCWSKFGSISKLRPLNTFFTFCLQQPGSDRLQPCRHCLEKLSSAKNWRRKNRANIWKMSMPILPSSFCNQSFTPNLWCSYNSFISRWNLLFLDELKT
jgi:hypothetical protein